MSRKKVWFCTQSHGEWIPCPDAGVEASRIGWQTQGQQLNGGAYVRRSASGHKEVTYNWTNCDISDLIPIINFSEGLYGDAPFYMLDPTVHARNFLPQWFASPFLGGLDAPILSGTKTRGSIVATPTNTNGYPTRSITYTLTGSETPLRVYVPIPPGYVARIGAHGSATGTAGLTVYPYTSSGASSSAGIALASVTSTALTSLTYSGNTYTGLYIALSGAGTVTLSGIIAQIQLIGTSAPTGAFISGQGHGGTQFQQFPTYNPYSAVFGDATNGKYDGIGSLSMQLVEVENF